MAPRPITPETISSRTIIAAAVVGGMAIGGVAVTAWNVFRRDVAPRAVDASEATPIPKKRGHVRGEIFITANDGAIQRFGSVPVSLIPLSALQPHLDQKKASATSALQEIEPRLSATKKNLDTVTEAWSAAVTGHGTDVLERLKFAQEQKQAIESEYALILEKYNQILSGGYYFDEMPAPAATTQTNADGWFRINVPRTGEFALAAAAHRTAGDHVDSYYWLLKLPEPGSRSKPLQLTNDNTTAVASPASLILTKY